MSIDSFEDFMREIIKKRLEDCDCDYCMERKVIDERLKSNSEEVNFRIEHFAKEYELHNSDECKKVRERLHELIDLFLDSIKERIDFSKKPDHKSGDKRQVH